MKYALLAFLLVPLLVFSGAASAAAVPATRPAGNWTTIYDDEFHSSASLAHYNTCYRWACAGGWNGELERYTPSSVTVANGKLDLQATKCAVTAHKISYHYCSGMVTTADKFSFLYGYAEARVLLPAGQGLWPAFWLLAQNGQSTTELDVMEVLGNDPSTINVGSHWLVNGKHKHHGAAVKGADLSAGYHTVAVDWEPDHMTFYEDGAAIWTTTDTAAIPATPMYLIFNLAVGGFWPGNPNASTPFPSDFLVDWVHVYQHPAQSTHSKRLKGYVTCAGIPPRTGGYYYNVEPNDPHGRGLLDTLQKVADSYKLPLDDVAADNPLVTTTQTLPIGMSICVPYGYKG